MLYVQCTYSTNTHKHSYMHLRSLHKLSLYTYIMCVCACVCAKISSNTHVRFGPKWNFFLKQYKPDIFFIFRYSFFRCRRFRCHHHRHHQHHCCIRMFVIHFFHSFSRLFRNLRHVPIFRRNIPPHCLYVFWSHCLFFSGEMCFSFIFGRHFHASVYWSLSFYIFYILFSFLYRSVSEFHDRKTFCFPYSV